MLLATAELEICAIVHAVLAPILTPLAATVRASMTVKPASVIQLPPTSVFLTALPCHLLLDVCVQTTASAISDTVRRQQALARVNASQ